MDFLSVFYSKRFINRILVTFVALALIACKGGDDQTDSSSSSTSTRSNSIATSLSNSSNDSTSSNKSQSVAPNSSVSSTTFSVLSSFSSATSNAPLSIELAANQTAFISVSALALDAMVPEHVEVAKVEFKRDDQLVDQVLSPPYQLHVPLNYSNNGTISFVATVYDTADNHANSNTITITVDIPPPDTENPVVTLSTDRTALAIGDILVLQAYPTDNVGVEKVVFLQDGEIIFESTSAPYTLNKLLVKTDEGSVNYSAIAYDTADNTAESDSIEITVTGNSSRFVGATVENMTDASAVASHFNQVTLKNAGQWSTLENRRANMYWSSLDAAYNFSKEQGKPFKLPLQLLGTQAPYWLEDLTLAQQREELAELMTLIANRYPDIDIVDVVNDPIHTPTVERAIFGDDSTSEWNWIINAASVARTHFPSATLVMNGSNVLILEERTQALVDVIEAIKDSQSIDAIGIPAHNLERVEIETVAANLQLLADTGLPIYITELDVGFTNDAQQAKVLKELFTTFWENPAVIGVNYWGASDGSTYRENTHLVHEDGTERPALTWLKCFYSGESDCTVPEYEPTGWAGDNLGLTLEAELYDSGQGLVALDDVVAWANEGDWFSFQNVSFSDSWTSLHITYTKGGDEAGSVSVYLDDPNGVPVTTMNLEPTGSWNDLESVELAWPTTDGEHDVYFKFHGVEGIANLDQIRFGKDINWDLGANLIQNGDFESGSNSGWYSWYNGVKVNSTHVYDGNYSLMVENGPMVRRLSDNVEAGSTYRINVVASIKGANSADVNITQRIYCEEDKTYEYTWIAGPRTINEGEWVHLTGDMVLPDCTLDNVAILIERPEQDVDLYIDNIFMQKAVPYVEIQREDFEEDSVANWFTSNGSLSISEHNAYVGDYSLLFSERVGYGSAGYELTNDVDAGKTYLVSLGVAIEGAEKALVRISQHAQCKDEEPSDKDPSDVESSSEYLASAEATAEGEWFILKGTMIVPECELEAITLYADGPEFGINILLDSLVVGQVVE